MSLVLSVSNVCFSNIRESIPQQITVLATGNVSTSGWGPGKLLPRDYDTPPADGVQEFEFKAQAPTDTVLQVISPVQGSFDGEIADWVVGVRVITRTNSTTVMLDEPSCAVPAVEIADI